MGTLVILMVMEQNGMYIPAWAIWIACLLLMISFLNAIFQIVLRWDCMKNVKGSDGGWRKAT